MKKVIVKKMNKLISHNIISMFDFSNIYNIYKFILLIFIVINILIIVWIMNNLKQQSIKTAGVWVNILFILNFANMYYTYDYYIKNINKLGAKGEKGDIGRRGYRGKGFICSQCGDAGMEKKDIYTTNVNDYEKTVKSSEVQSGVKCIFPFFHNGEAKYNCDKTQRKPGVDNDAYKNGWCATSLNLDGTYKNYGYCDLDQGDKEAKLEEIRKRRRQYILNNTGLLDLKVIMGNRSNITCPSGYEKINKDLNKNSGGKYIYLCKKMGIGSGGISNLSTVNSGTGDVTCPDGYRQIPQNLNQDSGGNDIRLCKQKSNKGYITDVIVQDNPDCPDNYTEISGNVNAGSGGEDVHICVSKVQNTLTFDCIFTWEKNKRTYIFRGENYWLINDKTKKSVDGYPKKIKTKWGNLPSNIDAAFTWGYDRKLYFFQGDKYWLFDDQRLEIAPGYPKFINDFWKGVPNNITAAFTWGKDKKTYFFYNEEYYRFNDKSKEVEKGYPRKINLKWKNGPEMIDAAFTYGYDNKTYFFNGNRYWILGPGDSILPGYPRDIDNVFKCSEKSTDGFTIKVRTLSGNVFKFSVSPSDSVKSVRQKIKDKDNSFTDSNRLYFDGVAMGKTGRLSEYKIVENSLIKIA